jgi:signal transduction histidine kinase/ActR/RegA family two-component response regulator
MQVADSFESVAGPASRLERLHAFTRALAQAITPEEVVDAIVNAGREATEAQMVALWLLSRGGSEVCLARSAGNNCLRPEEYKEIPLAGPPRLAIFDAIRKRAPVWVESGLQLEQRYPDVAAMFPSDKADRSLACVPLFVQNECIGGLAFKFESARRFVEEERAFLQVVAWHSAQAIERSRLYAAEKRAREAAEASQRRSDFLSDAGMILASSLDYSATLVGVIRAAVPRVADWCIVELEEDRLQGIPAVASHVDPAKVPLVLELSARFRAKGDRDYGIPAVLRSGKAQLYPPVSMQEIREWAGDDIARLFEGVGLVSSMVVPISARGNVLGAIVLNSTSRQYDESDLAMAEQLGRKAGLAVDGARLYRDAREADRQKDEFLAMLSHELRNPLAPIVAALDLMKLRSVEACAAEREVISRNVKHIVRLVDDLLDVARITRGKVELRREPCQVSQVVAKAVEMVAPLIGERGQTLTTTLPATGLPVLADQARLAQAISNLLANANKYTPFGGKISVVAVAEASAAVIRIADSGIGIAPETLPRIFDLFVQEKRALDRAQGGLGIGLTVVKALVGLHGGSVSAKSDGLGKGSEFAIRIPLASPAHAAPVAKPPFSSAPIDTGAPVRVVVVDDNVDAAGMLGESIRALGCPVRVAVDAPSALATAAEFRPNLLFVDIGLPGMDGYELIGHLRGLDTAPKRIVALTGYGQEDDYRRSREAGFDEHIVKPMSIDTLRGILERSRSYLEMLGLPMATPQSRFNDD